MALLSCPSSCLLSPASTSSLSPERSLLQCPGLDLSALFVTDWKQPSVLSGYCLSCHWLTSRIGGLLWLLGYPGFSLENSVKELWILVPVVPKQTHDFGQATSLAKTLSWSPLSKGGSMSSLINTCKCWLLLLLIHLLPILIVYNCFSILILIISNGCEAQVR